MNFIRNLFKRDKYRIIERGNGRFSAQEKCWSGWRNIETSVYQSVCHDVIVKRKREEQIVDDYKTIKRVIKV